MYNTCTLGRLNLHPPEPQSRGTKMASAVLFSES